MAIVPIVKTKNNNSDVPDVLTTKCTEVETINDEVIQIVKNLIDTANATKNPEAAGLSAPQIGILKRICLVKKFTFAGDEEIVRNFILINPRIVRQSKKTDIRYEACFSIPNTFGQVERAKKVRIKALNENGEKIKIKATGFFARIIQHELDHLDGILFTSKTIGEAKTDEEYEKLKEPNEN